MHEHTVKLTNFVLSLHIGNVTLDNAILCITQNGEKDLNESCGTAILHSEKQIVGTPQVIWVDNGTALQHKGIPNLYTKFNIVALIIPYSVNPPTFNQ